MVSEAEVYYLIDIKDGSMKLERLKGDTIDILKWV